MDKKSNVVRTSMRKIYDVLIEIDVCPAVTTTVQELYYSRSSVFLLHNVASRGSHGGK